MFADISALTAREDGTAVAHVGLQRIWFSCQGGDGGGGARERRAQGQGQGRQGRGQGARGTRGRAGGCLPPSSGGWRRARALYARCTCSTRTPQVVDDGVVSKLVEMGFAKGHAASGVRARPARDTSHWGYQMASAGRSVLQFDAAPPPRARWGPLFLVSWPDG